MFKASRKDREATEKRKVLRALIDGEGDKCTNAIIFCNRKMDVDAVAKSLKKYGYDAAPIHGDLEQSQRTRTLDGFRAGDLRFLVASDVAARGLDVPSVSHVFNFDVPSHAEDYVHRIGRTGRAGRDGKAIMICSPRDEKNFENVERLVQKEIPRLEDPLAGSSKADAAPKPTTETAAPADAATTDKPKRTRSRSRKKPEAPKPVEAVAVVVEAPVETPAVPAAVAPAPEAAKPAPEKAPEAKAPEAEKSDRRTPRSRGGSRKNDNRNENRNGNAIVGLGDHTPTFIELSFADRPKN
jgi:superfamily II DNA/RNA helicase